MAFCFLRANLKNFGAQPNSSQFSANTNIQRATRALSGKFPSSSVEWYSLVQPQNSHSSAPNNTCAGHGEALSYDNVTALATCPNTCLTEGSGLNIAKQPCPKQIRLMFHWPQSGLPASTFARANTCSSSCLQRSHNNPTGVRTPQPARLEIL